MENSMVSNLQMRLRSSRPLFKLLQGMAFSCIVLANLLPSQAEPTKNNKIIQQQASEDNSTLKILEDKARALEKEGKYKEAAQSWEAIIEFAEKNFGHFTPDIAPILNKLGNLYSRQGEYSKAEPLYVRSLAVYEKVLGPDHHDVSMSLNNLAVLFF